MAAPKARAVEAPDSVEQYERALGRHAQAVEDARTAEQRALDAFDADPKKIDAAQKAQLSRERAERLHGRAVAALDDARAKAAAADRAKNLGDLEAGIEHASTLLDRVAPQLQSIKALGAKLDEMVLDLVADYAEAGDDFDALEQRASALGVLPDFQQKLARPKVEDLRYLVRVAVTLDRIASGRPRCDWLADEIEPSWNDATRSRWESAVATVQTLTKTEK